MKQLPGIHSCQHRRRIQSIRHSKIGMLPGGVDSSVPFTNRREEKYKRPENIRMQKQ